MPSHGNTWSWVMGCGSGGICRGAVGCCCCGGSCANWGCCPGWWKAWGGGIRANRCPNKSSITVPGCAHATPCGERGAKRKNCGQLCMQP
eukprot:1153994-Pelagomonas_calceolata.AAC.7